MNIQQIKEAFLQLIRIPSITGSAGEREAIDFLEQLLLSYGISTERISKSSGQPNLLGVIKAEKPRKKPLVLISHIDVAEVEVGKWSCVPFAGICKDGRIWGRGPLDTKHLTMMELYAFLQLAGREKEMLRDVWFLAAADEEKGSRAGMEYVKSVKPQLFQDSIVINEGGGFPVCDEGKDYLMLTAGEKGNCRVRIWAEGTGGHASSPSDSQALQKLAAALETVLSSAQELKTGTVTVGTVMEEILGTVGHCNAILQEMKDYSSRNEIFTDKFQIGTRNNVIPSAAEAVLVFRILPGITQEDIQNYLDKVLKGNSVRYQVLSFEPGFADSEEGLRTIMLQIEELCRKHGFACRTLPMLAIGRTDGRFFGQSGSEVYGCSPVLPGDSFEIVLPKVHGNDENILEESFEFGCRVLGDWVKKECLEEG